MEYRELGNLGVSVIGLGTLRAFDVTEESDLAFRWQIIENCISANINFIDSAAMYGAAEKAVGITTEGKRDRFYLATKVRIEGKEAGERQIAQSFENLNTGYIDLLQIHNMIDYQTHLPTLERLKDEGKIGMIGVTAMVDEAYPAIMDLMRSGRIDTVQIPYNVVQREVEERLLPLAEELGTGIMVMEPLKKGRYVNELRTGPHTAERVRHQDLGPGAAILGGGGSQGQHHHPRNVTPRAGLRERALRKPRSHAPRAAGLR